MSDSINVSDNLRKLKEITKWFDEQSQVDVEEGLSKVKEAAVLIKQSKLRLQEIENEFEEIQADLSDGEDVPEAAAPDSTLPPLTSGSSDDNDPNGLPF